MNYSFLREIQCISPCGHILQMADELLSAHVPGPADRKGATCVARNVKSPQTSRAETVTQHANGIVADYVLRPGDGKRRDRDSAGLGFALDDAERIGPAWKNKNVAGSGSTLIDTPGDLPPSRQCATPLLNRSASELLESRQAKGILC